MTPAEHAAAYNTGLEAAAQLAAKRSRDHKRRVKRVAAAGYADSAIFHDGCATLADDLAKDIRTLKVNPDISGDAAFRSQREAAEDMSDVAKMIDGFNPATGKRLVDAPPASGDGALGAVSGNSASEWQDGPEPVYAPLSASECGVARPTGYWNPSILDRLRGWLR